MGARLCYFIYSGIPISYAILPAYKHPQIPYKSASLYALAVMFRTFAFLTVILRRNAGMVLYFLV